MAGTPLRILLIHGLPQRRGSPLEQMNAIDAVCQSLGLPTQSYQWAVNRGLVPLIRLLGNPSESFLSTYARRFDVEFRTILKNLDEQHDDSRFAVIAYSAGGALLYYWAAAMASDAELQRIAGVIMVAAPHTVPGAFVFEDLPDKPIPVLNEHAPAPAAVLNRFVQARIPLKVLVGSFDLTVPPSNSSFGGALGVEEHMVLASHSTICSHQATIDQIIQWLRALR